MNIMYVDDEQTEINNFRRSFLLLNDQLNIIGICPEYTIEDTYASIIQNGEIDAVITDYDLSDGCDVSFTGADLIKMLAEKHPLLSCFVLTAFESNAVNSDAIDVYQVYPKSLLKPDSNENTENGMSFHDLVIAQIEKDKRKLIGLEKEHEELKAQRNGDDWTSEKEERLIYCDNILEHHYSGKKISGLLKKRDYSEKIVALIEATKELLDEVKKNDSNSSKQT